MSDRPLSEPRATEFPFAVRPPERVATAMREAGWWRDQSIVHDLLSAAAERPDAPAVISRRTDDRRTITLRYAELARYAERFGAALLTLGVRKGDRVAFQLPAWWEAAALTLACAWVGAVAVPVLPTIRERELERMLRLTEASVCVSAGGVRDGYDAAEALRAVSPRLPALRHTVIYGDHVPDEATDFELYFMETAHEDALSAPLRAPSGSDMDAVAVVMFTSGTTGERKAVLHTENTLYAGTAASSSPIERSWDTGEVPCSPHPVSGLAGLLYCLWGPILAKGTGVYMDAWKPHELLDLMADAGVTQVFAAPPFAAQLAEAQQSQPRSVPSLQFIMCGGAAVYPKLTADVRAAFSVPVRTCWGMTELGLGIRTGADDPEGWAAHSDGRPIPGLEISLREEGPEEDVRRLWVRGPSVCVAMWEPESDGGLRCTWERDEGWMDTGDLVREDGAGGVRFVGRAGRRVGGPYMIPVADVENEILHHPSVRETVIIGYADEQGQEHACAVLAPAEGASCPGLEELRAFLARRGMTEWYLPERVLEVPELPKNENGKVLDAPLRSRIAELERTGAPVR